MADDREQLQKRIDHDLTLHPPIHPYIGEGMDSVRAAAKAFAFECIDKGCCPSRELSLALTKIEEALFYAIASIARYQGEADAESGPATTTHEILVNTKRFTWAGDTITYSDLVILAQEEGQPTVVYSLRYEDGKSKDGSPVYDEAIDMTGATEAIFDVVHTNRA